MKLAINAASAKMGGNLNYVCQVLGNLAERVKDGQELIVFLPPSTADRIGPLPPNIRIIPVKAGEWSWWRRLWWEQVTLRRLINAEGADALFSTGSFGMFRCQVRQILLVRNALYFSPDYESLFLKRHNLSYRIAFWLRRRLILGSVRTADVVMTPTQAMMDSLRRHSDAPAEKFVVNPYGAPCQDADRREAGRQDASPVSADTQTVRLLFVSLYSEHKNLSTLLKALPILNQNHEVHYILDTTADPGWEGGRWTVTCREDSAMAAEASIRPWVKIRGPLDRDQTHDLYKRADIFVFPSLVESFGFPMVEAMAFKLPLVAADTPVNREVCGEAAVYFSPLSAEDLAAQIQRLAEDDSLRKRLAEAGRLRVKEHFRWEDHARKILECAKLAD
jgi:glycosyltransferase involved in cell wall biosynthesis